MPRRIVPFVPGEYYHIYNRGNNRQAIFFTPENYLYFLKGIKKYLIDHLEIIAYCLMPTHYHILAKINNNGDINMSSQVSLAMQKLLISYTKAINQRFSRAGSIFQGQFRSKRVEKTAHLIQLCVYIHSNPVKAHLTTSPEYWEYSNYQEWIGLRKGSLVNVEFIQDHFRSADEYRKLISEYIQHENMTDEVRSFIQSLES